MTAEAVSQFDAAAQAIFTATITACKLTRPNASVGYYGYPGMISPADPKPKSFAGPELLWLWRQLGVLTPSDYLWTAFDGKQTERARVNVEMSLHLVSFSRFTAALFAALGLTCGSACAATLWPIRITRQQSAQRNGCDRCADRLSLCGTRPAAAPRSCPTSGSGPPANPIPHAATARSRRKGWILQPPCKSRRRWAPTVLSFGEPNAS